ncbi:MAG: hypothetical protein H7336_09780 [Bacteriovorax sp.]|nr:hypothetical protein [Bacteriovorax sp.]
MNTDIVVANSLAHLWRVLVLFLIPIGGGIPAGVILAQSYKIAWPMMMLVYFISDVILACLFEPIMYLVMFYGKNVPFIIRFGEVFKEMVKKTTENFGNNTGPFALILLAFGVDPMTGRAAAIAAGHGFITGWAIAIAGDMIYFTLLMVSTIWLNGIIGDGTWTTIIIFGLMMLIPTLIRRFREKK